MPVPIAVDNSNYEAFLTTREFAVLHFDAVWDARYRESTRRAMQLAEQELGETVSFGEADVDRPAMVPIAKAIGVANVPLVAYYKSGRLVAALVGAGQDVPERTRRLVRGEPIGRRDGTGTLIMPEPFPQS